MNKQETYLPFIIELVREVSKHILAIYHRPNPVEISNKADNTPLTEADVMAHQLITNGLQQLTPDMPIISEESLSIEFSERQRWQKLWLVDPLDGTKEFLAKTDEFSINIALIENHQPIFGLVHAPVFDLTYYAFKNKGAYKLITDQQPELIHTRKLEKNQPIIIASRRHGENIKLQNFLQKLGPYQRISKGSALKFCLIAEGIADVYPRFGDTSEWDTAAGQCIVEAAGGAVFDTNSQPLRYNARPTLLNPHFIAVGDPKNFFNSFLIGSVV